MRLIRFGRNATNKLNIGDAVNRTTSEAIRKKSTKHYQVTKEDFLVQARLAMGKPINKSAEAVEHILYFSWIRSTEENMDGECYATRFTPRAPKSNRRETSKQRANYVISQKKMTAAGHVHLPSGVWHPAKTAMSSSFGYEGAERA